jgi:hypothetical protein
VSIAVIARNLRLSVTTLSCALGGYADATPPTTVLCATDRTGAAPGHANAAAQAVESNKTAAGGHDDQEGTALRGD